MIRILKYNKKININNLKKQKMNLTKNDKTNFEKLTNEQNRSIIRS